MKLVFSTILAFIAVANAVPVDFGFDGMDAGTRRLLEQNGRKKVSDAATALGLGHIDTDKVVSAFTDGANKMSPNVKKLVEKEIQKISDSDATKDAKTNGIQLFNQFKTIWKQNKGNTLVDLKNALNREMSKQIKKIDNAEIEKAAAQTTKKLLEIAASKLGRNKNLTLANAAVVGRTRVQGALRDNGIATSNKEVFKQTVLRKVKEKLQGKV